MLIILDKKEMCIDKIKIAKRYPRNYNLTKACCSFRAQISKNRSAGII